VTRTRTETTNTIATMNSRELFSRRSFLKRATGTAFGASVFNTLLDLRLINNAMAGVNVSDYKALVCVFLDGGNDCNNMIIPAPADPRYAGYKSIRGPRLALWEDQAAAAARPLIDGAANPNNYWGVPLSTALTGSDAYAVHNSMAVGVSNTVPHSSVKSLFDTGKLSFVSNLGVLAYPVTKAQVNSKSAKLPPQLFSHNDQVTQWQTGVPDAISRTGWGGRTMDKMREELARLGIPPGSISMSVSLSGSNTWEVGDTVNQFQVSTSGAVSFTNYTGARKTIIDQVLRDATASAGGDATLSGERTNLHLRDFQKVNERAIFNGAALSQALTRLTAGQPDAAVGTQIDQSFGIVTGGTTFNNLSSLEQQLHTVARIISQRGFLGMQRQIFFVKMGGHDTHGDQPVAHAGLVSTASRAMGRFYDAMVALGVANKVTQFTASDFGRTFKSNGLGSDHAWGSHHMVCGGAVSGGRIFGTFPVLSLNGPDDYDSGSGATGRWIPKLSIDEYCATLARWFGLGEAELDAVFPNLHRFSSRNLGFMA
jgi:uncharacterized protein (DUF1501 family)